MKSDVRFFLFILKTKKIGISYITLKKIVRDALRVEFISQHAQYNILVT